MNLNRESNNNKFRLIFNEAKHHQKQEKLDLAIEKYQKAVEINPQCIEAWKNLGLIYHRQKKIHEAITSYQQAITLNSQNANLYIKLGRVLVKDNQLDKAMVAYKEAITLDGDLPSRVYCELGKLLLQQGQLNKFFKEYLQLVDIASDKKNNYCEIGSFLVTHKKIDLAIACYQKIINIDPNFYHPHLCLGDIYRNKKNLDRAIDCYLKALSINPKDTEVPKRLRKILRDVDISEEKLNKVTQVVENLLVKSNESILLYGIIGDSLTRKNKVKKAIDYYHLMTYRKNYISRPQFVKSYWNNSNEKNKDGPNFIVIGAMKCGTTSLHNYILKHPQVLPSRWKELHFFSDDRRFSLGLDWYLSHFPPRPEKCGYITGESTPAYLVTPVAAQRLRDSYPNTKLIVILRNPIDRAVSHYHFVARQGRSHRTLDIEKALYSALDSINQAGTIHDSMQGVNFIDRSLYTIYIEKWMDIFPQENFLILKTEDFGQDSNQVMQNVFTFLELPHFNQYNYSRKGASSYAEISPSLRRRMSDFFRPYNERLENHLGITFNWK